MNTIIRDDFVKFLELEELFNSDVELYDSQGGSVVYEGRGCFDRKPQLVENQDGQLGYSGHKSILSLSKSELTFMTSYFSLKGYYVEITDNDGTHNYLIEESNFSSNVGKIYCELKTA